MGMANQVMSSGHKHSPHQQPYGTNPGYNPHGPTMDQGYPQGINY